MSSYAEDLVRQWELDDPRDRWRHTGERPPSTHARREPIQGWKPTEDQERDSDRMQVCSVCGGDAVFGFDVTVEGVRMGDIGSWRCVDHHPFRKARYTREEWAQSGAAGTLYPESSEQSTEAAE
jgi:hypothetical protein